MNRSLNASALILALAGNCLAGPMVQLGNSAAVSESAAGTASLGAAKAASGQALGEGAAPAPVAAEETGARADFKTSLINAEGRKLSLKAKEPPSPKGPGLLARTGSTLKEHSAELLSGGIGMAGGALAAKVAGFGLLGGVLAGGLIGVGALYLHKKGETGAAIGAASFGLAGLALGGPIGGIVGAVVGGLGAWMLKKFFYG
ncbi:MAG: hypothetical protein HYZ75_05695 [Elusimicrobia bacterium]|nr:hypothetical protein [Elusimicrobiota bacterium]